MHRSEPPKEVLAWTPPPVGLCCPREESHQTLRHSVEALSIRDSPEFLRAASSPPSRAGASAGDFDTASVWRRSEPGSARLLPGDAGVGGRLPRHHCRGRGRPAGAGLGRRRRMCPTIRNAGLEQARALARSRMRRTMPQTKRPAMPTTSPALPAIPTRRRRDQRPREVDSAQQPPPWAGQQAASQHRRQVRRGTG